MCIVTVYSAKRPNRVFEKSKHKQAMIALQDVLTTHRLANLCCQCDASPDMKLALCYETIMFGLVTFVSILLRFIYTGVICYDYLALFAVDLKLNLLLTRSEL